MNFAMLPEQAQRDITLVAEYLVGWWPGLEDGISWGDGIKYDEDPRYLAAVRLYRWFKGEDVYA